MWQKPIKKCVFTLNVGGYATEITDLTYPLMKGWCAKIGADFHVITERKFSEWPITYEKFQIYELAKEGKYMICEHAKNNINMVLDIEIHENDETVIDNFMKNVVIKIFPRYGL